MNKQDKKDLKYQIKLQKSFIKYLKKHDEVGTRLFAQYQLKHLKQELKGG